jgi:hypothetical protein
MSELSKQTIESSAGSVSSRKTELVKRGYCQVAFRADDKQIHYCLRDKGHEGLHWDWLLEVVA